MRFVTWASVRARGTRPVLMRKRETASGEKRVPPPAGKLTRNRPSRPLRLGDRRQRNRCLAPSGGQLSLHPKSQGDVT